MLRAAVGHSEDVDAEDAAREALDACEVALAGAAPIAAIVFAGSMKDPSALLAAIAAAHPNLPVVGSTAMAELSSRISHAESSFAVMMLASDTVTVSVGFATDAVGDERGAARRAVDMARARLVSEPRLCIAFSNAVRVNISHVIEGLTSALGNDVPVVGGASACEFTGDLEVRELCGTDVLKESVVVMLLGGRLRFAYAMDRGWTPIGTAHVATKTMDNIVVEIDGRPALDIYKQYLGAPGHAGAMFVHHPLAVFEGSSTDFYLRAGFAEGPVPGSIVTAGNVPQGATLRLTEYQREHVVEAAALAAREARRQWGAGDPAAALVFTCSTRKTVLGTWTAREVDALRAALPESTPFAGFYAFSELAPFSPGKPACVHNGSFVTLLLGEA
jgi:hypothetical protein